MSRGLGIGKRAILDAITNGDYLSTTSLWFFNRGALYSQRLY
jgi:hypothetical protein